jgi:choline dehydrogenase-like flavoprotein
MGDNPNTSVVDKNLKLHNNKNLYVLGSSNFLSGGYANPTYTIIQMSLRLSNEILNKLL